MLLNFAEIRLAMYTWLGSQYTERMGSKILLSTRIGVGRTSGAKGHTWHTLEANKEQYDQQVTP